MPILLYTDASTKNGASCWAYKTSLSNEVVTGVCLTSNTAAMETLAISMGVKSLPKGSQVMVISDFMGAVNTITYRDKQTRSGESIYRKCRAQLLSLCEIYSLEAIWVPSKCSNKHHLEVDQMSKLILQEYLNNNPTVNLV